MFEQPDILTINNQTYENKACGQQLQLTDTEHKNNIQYCQTFTEFVRGY